YGAWKIVAPLRSVRVRRPPPPPLPIVLPGNDLFLRGEFTTREGGGMASRTAVVLPSLFDIRKVESPLLSRPIENTLAPVFGLVKLKKPPRRPLRLIKREALVMFWVLLNERLGSPKGETPISI